MEYKVSITHIFIYRYNLGATLEYDILLCLIIPIVLIM